jgi:hypothetical protein
MQVTQESYEDSPEFRLEVKELTRRILDQCRTATKGTTDERFNASVNALIDSLIIHGVFLERAESGNIKEFLEHVTKQLYYTAGTFDKEWASDADREIP